MRAASPTASLQTFMGLTPVGSSARIALQTVVPYSGLNFSTSWAV